MKLKLLKPQSENADTLRREWVSLKLRKTVILPLIVVDVLLIGTLCVLWALSTAWHGFTEISNTSHNLGTVQWHLGLLWTSFPSLVLQVFSIVVWAVAREFGIRQTFVELVRGGRSEQTITLDYQAMWPGAREVQAVRNRHYHLFAAFLVSVLAQVVLAPFGARLLAEQPYDYPSSVDLPRSLALLTSSTSTQGLDWDLSTILGMTTASTIYGGTNPTWSDGNRTFLSFDIKSLQSRNFTQASVSAITSAYYATLDCTEIKDIDRYIVKTPDPADPTGKGSLALSGVDQRCSWDIRFGVTQNTRTYLRTSSTVGCGQYRGSAQSGRLTVVGGTVPSMNETRLVGISCIPVYWTTKGQIRMDLRQNVLQPIMDWTENVNEVTEFRPQWWNLFEKQLNQLENLDTTVDGGVTKDSATGLGRVILEKIRKTPQQVLSADTLIAAISTIYGNLYSNLIVTFMMRPAAQVTTVKGELSVTQIRLVVIPVMACIILVLLLAMLAILIVALVYTNNHRSGQFEEPIGPLGSASMWLDSNLNPLLVQIREQDEFHGKVRSNLLSAFTAKGVSPTFQLADYHNPSRARIVMDEVSVQKLSPTATGEGDTSLAVPGVVSHSTSSISSVSISHSGDRMGKAVHSMVSAVDDDVSNERYSSGIELHNLSESRPLVSHQVQQSTP